jgi:hypothetical protein
MSSSQATLKTDDLAQPLLKLAPPGRPTPSAQCTAALDAFCSNATQLVVCYAAMRQAGSELPLFAAFSGFAGQPTSKVWRCYSPSDLTADPRTTPLLERQYVNRTTAGYCTMGNLTSVLDVCNPLPRPPPAPPSPFVVQPVGVPVTVVQDTIAMFADSMFWVADKLALGMSDQPDAVYPSGNTGKLMWSEDVGKHWSVATEAAGGPLWIPKTAMPSIKNSSLVLGYQLRRFGPGNYTHAYVHAQRIVSSAGALTQVRKTPSWPRSWANFSLHSCIIIGMRGQLASFGPT